MNVEGVSKFTTNNNTAPLTHCTLITDNYNKLISREPPIKLSEAPIKHESSSSAHILTPCVYISTTETIRLIFASSLSLSVQSLIRLLRVPTPSDKTSWMASLKERVSGSFRKKHGERVGHNIS